MSDPIWDHPFRVIGEVLSLNGDVLGALSRIQGSWSVGLLVLLAAGVSEALGQSVVLFANRVRPWRFGASVLLTALSYLVGLLCFVGSTIFLADQLFGQHLVVQQVLLIALWSFAPHLIGFLILTPYAGGFISLCLAAWSFLVMTSGVHAISTLSLTQAALCLVLGWLLWQLLRRSLGWPVVRAARWVRSRVAGAPLVTDRDGLEHLFKLRKEAALIDTKGGTGHDG